MTVRLVQACAECGNTTFAYKDGDFECLACGEINEFEDLTTKVVEVHELSGIGLMETADLVKKLDEVKDIVETKVYRVFDDEWEDIMGDKQIREFAINQLCDKAEDFIKEAKEGYNNEEDGKAIETLYNKVLNQNYTKLTLDEIRLVFNAFYFDFEELHIL